MFFCALYLKIKLHGESNALVSASSRDTIIIFSALCQCGELYWNIFCNKWYNGAVLNKQKNKKQNCLKF